MVPCESDYCTANDVLHDKKPSSARATKWEVHVVVMIDMESILPAVMDESGCAMEVATGESG